MESVVKAGTEGLGPMGAAEDYNFWTDPGTCADRPEGAGNVALYPGKPRRGLDETGF